MKKICQFLLLILCSITPLEAHSTFLCRLSFRKRLQQWHTPPYWNGNTTLHQENGRHYLKLQATQRNNRFFGRTYGYCKERECFPSEIITIRLKAKGSGTFFAGCLAYHANSGRPEYCPAPCQKLDKSFKTYDFTVTLSEHVAKVLPYVEINGPGTMLVDWVHVLQVQRDDVTIKAQPSLQVLTDASKLRPITFKTSLRGQPIYISQNNHAWSLPVREDGTVTVSPKPWQGRELALTASAQSARETAYALVDDAADWKTSNNLAAKIRLKGPTHVLVLGDSLSDWFRGRNFIDRLQFWLNTYNPGLVTIRNAGVGGDFTTRMADRLRGTLPENKTKAYRQNMYDNLFNPHKDYDIIFIFLGQNDTRARRSQKYAKPFIAKDVQRRDLTFIIDFIQKRSKARIVMISPSPSNVKVFKLREAKAKPETEIYMYGIKDYVDDFDAVNRQICKERNLDYVDILTPMRKASAPQTLFLADGVHLTPVGGRLIADELLRYLAASPVSQPAQKPTAGHAHGHP